MRGKGVKARYERVAVGITPAHAGKRLLGRLPGMGGPDHPRACGEKTPVRFYENGVPGSPPRMRGKGVKARYERVAVGITPAHAGKRRRSPSTPRRWKDHPRACGEKDLSEAGADELGGSPPRMRGKVNFPAQVRPFHGITPAHAEKRRSKPTSWTCPGDHPAYAGKSTSAPAGCPAPWDHPRVCGEKLLQPQKGLGPAGSPPCMRGKEVAVLVQ